MKQIKQKDWDRLQASHPEIDAIQAKIEDYLDEVRAKLDELQTEVNEALQKAHGQLDDLANEAQAYYDERSEKWQESDAGSAYADWINELQSASDMLSEEVSLDIQQGVDLSPLHNALELIDGGFRQSPDE